MVREEILLREDRYCRAKEALVAGGHLNAKIARYLDMLDKHDCRTSCVEYLIATL